MVRILKWNNFFLQEHFYLETQATIAVPKGEDGEMELFVSTQNPTLTQVRKPNPNPNYNVFTNVDHIKCSG